MKQTKRALAGLALAAALLTGSVFAAVPAASENSCVLDEANVLSERTEQAVNDLTIALDEACGAQIGVLTVEFTGDSTTADFAVDTSTPGAWAIPTRTTAFFCCWSPARRTTTAPWAPVWKRI